MPQPRRTQWHLGLDAVEKELGLTLAKQKRAIPVIVVDHLDEKPIE